MIRIDNYELGTCILHELIKRGIRNSIFDYNGEFSEQELNMIDHLTLTGISNLMDIDKLPQLKTLNIYSYPSSNLIEFDSSLINDIFDFSILANLNSLEELRIYNDNNIEFLDITNLKKLKVLDLFNNPNLTEIKGLDELKNLENVSLINNGFKTIGDTKKYITNTMDTAQNTLDIKLFISLFGHEEERKFLERQLRQALSNITFGEKTTFDDGKYIISYDQAKDMYFRALRILKYLEIKEVNLDTIKKIHEYVAFSIKYDTKGLNYRDRTYFNLSDKKSEKEKYILKRLKLMNTSYAALVNKKAVCEGYVNMMIFLLSIIGIEARMVNCSYEGIEFNHAAIKFKFNGIWYYADPERERLTEETDEFGYTFEEFKQRYNIPVKEYLDMNKLERGRK